MHQMALPETYGLPGTGNPDMTPLAEILAADSPGHQH